MEILKWLLFFLFSFSLGAETKRSKYFIAIKKNEGNGWNDLETFIPLLPPKGKFYADPFLFKHEGKNYLFFENYDYKKGVISYVTLEPNGMISNPQLALELPTHLSFPFIFRDKETIYMVPETYRSKSVSLYRSVLFPHQWERQRVLIRGQCFSDPILFFYHDYYWLFVAVHRDQLCIYYAKDLESRFLSHPINTQNVKGRNAGPVFTFKGMLIRPTMDCSQRYGKSMILKEIIRLTTEEFEEKEVALIESNWAPDLDGTHSFCQSEDYLAYDGERLISLEEDALYSAP